MHIVHPKCYLTNQSKNYTLGASKIYNLSYYLPLLSELSEHYTYRYWHSGNVKIQVLEKYS